ncbi:hypothetical protein ACNG5Q_001068 [Escherichia coli]|nr:hypothetical protein [Escherichia coli]EFC4037445.1 hypothetical protein [Escherichia coli]EFE7985504.1 hypothetical protein [Escherichia coli]EFN9166655.1 hypothetical protein [Escherichia coli]EFN9713076.1 hypothetical protein [Escherichia coli]EFO3429052.1 hypothetical protein [Escherichia coli]
MAMIDPRTPIGKATLRYRGLPTRHLLSLLRLGVEDPERPYYSRDELIAMLVDRDLDNQLRRAFAKSSAARELES